LVRDDACGDAESVADLMQVVSELADESELSCWTCQQSSIWRQRIEGAEEAESLDKFCDEGIAGDQAFSLEFTEGDMKSPLIWACRTQAIERQVCTLSDAHAGAAQQQKDVSSQIVAAQELLFEELILFCGEWPR
jgi:hypothetical protein